MDVLGCATLSYAHTSPCEAAAQPSIGLPCSLHPAARFLHLKSVVCLGCVTSDKLQLTLEQYQTAWVYLYV